jgi:hypothetical protein
VNDILNAKALTPKRTPKKRGRKPKLLKDGNKNDNENAQVAVELSRFKESCATENKNHYKYTVHIVALKNSWTYLFLIS